MSKHGNRQSDVFATTTKNVTILVSRYFAPAKSNRAMKVGTGSTWNEGPGYSVALCFDPLPPNITQDSWNWIYLKWRPWVLGLGSLIVFVSTLFLHTLHKTEQSVDCTSNDFFCSTFALPFPFVTSFSFPPFLTDTGRYTIILKAKQVLLHLHFCYRTLNLNPLLAHYDRWCKVTSWSATTFQ